MAYFFQQIQIFSGNAEAYVIKEDVDGNTTEVIISKFTTEIIFETTVAEGLTEKTKIGSESWNQDIYNPTTWLNKISTDVKIESITEQAFSTTQDNPLAKDSHDTTISISTTNLSNIGTTFDEINEIKPASPQTLDEIDLVQNVHIFSSELFPHSKPFNTADNENQTNTESLEETIRNSVKNEIEVEQNFSSSAILDVLQEIPELQIRQSLADEILLNKDPYSEEEKENQVKPLKNSTTMSSEYIS